MQGLTPDNAAQNLEKIIADFADFCKSKGNVSEADTRAKVIDAILKDVCGWPENNISREDHINKGYSDYILSNREKELIILEAKREGVGFECPDSKQRRLMLSGAILSNENIKKAIMQVRNYCDDRGVRYAIASNGYTWIIFRAIRDDMPWSKGKAFVYKSLKDIRDNFTEFWNLMSFYSVDLGSLNKKFGATESSERLMQRVINSFRNPNRELERNRLDACLKPLVTYLFDDITTNDDILEKCYIYSSNSGIYANDINVTLKDTMPNQLLSEGGKEIKISRTGAGEFGNNIINKVECQNSEIYLVLGGIGAGKTTFLKRYQKTIGKELLSEKTIWFHLDLLAAPLQVDSLEPFIWKQVLDQLRDRYRDMKCEERRCLNAAYSNEINILTSTVLKKVSKKNKRYDEEISRALQKWSEDTCDYVPRILKFAGHSSSKKILLFIDNVDQMPADFQAKVFLLAQKISRNLNSLTVVSLREESYFVPEVQRIFTAYTNSKYHISSPEFRRLITKRIDYALENILSDDDVDELPASIQGLILHRKDLVDFLDIVKESIFSENRKIARFVDSVCFGNMRKALKMFSTFMISGAIDVDKMLKFYRRDGCYYVPFHEWLKSIILQDRFYYKESQSGIMNVFDCGVENNSSHFTCMRVLSFLRDVRQQATLLGDGYFLITRVEELFDENFDNSADLISSLNKMTRYQLIELNTKSSENTRNATHMRLSASGWYYLRFLSKSFCYLDLILQDTPINDWSTLNSLVASVKAVNNLYDREDQKLARVNARFERVDGFLKYLKTEENEEFGRYNIGETYGVFNRRFVHAIQKSFDKEKRIITERILSNINR